MPAAAGVAVSLAMYVGAAGQPQEDGVLDVLRSLFGPDGFVHPHLELASDQKNADRGRGLYVLKPISKGEVLLQVPLHRVLWQGTLKWAEAPGFQESVVGLSEDEKLVMYVAALRKYGIYSEWYNYIRTFPLQEPNSPLMWSPEEVASLLGTDAHGPARALRRSLLRLCNRFVDAFDCEHVRWAAALYWSRAVSISKAVLDPTSKQEHIHALIPGFDLVNYAADSSNYFRTAGKSLVYISGVDYAAGDEILDAYGRDKNDTFLLVHYGFLNERPEQSYLSLQPAVLPDRHQVLKQTLRLDQPSRVHELRIRTDDVEGISLLRLGMMPAQEFSAHNVHSILARAPLSVSRIPSTELLSMQWLRDACEQKLFGLQKFDNLSRVLCPSAGSFLSQEYRERSRGLWQECVKAAEERLKHLQPELMPPLEIPAPAPISQPGTSRVAGVNHSVMESSLATPLHGEEGNPVVKLAAAISGTGAAQLRAHCFKKSARWDQCAKAAVQMSGITTRLRKSQATAPWLGQLFQSGTEAPETGSQKVHRHACVLQHVIRLLQPSGSRIRRTARSPAATQANLSCAASCALRAFDWLGTLHGAAVGPALQSLGTALEEVAMSLGSSAIEC